MGLCVPYIDYDVISQVNHSTLRKGAYVSFMSTNNSSYIPIRLDKERMDKALSTNSIKMPRGLTREEKRAFLLNRAKQLQKT
nr:hypothetical protein [Moraxella sp. CTOTU47724]